MTDKALKKQIIKGCSNAECRKELVRLAPRTAMEAIDILKRVMNDLKDLVWSRLSKLGSRGLRKLANRRF